MKNIELKTDGEGCYLLIIDGNYIRLSNEEFQKLYKLLFEERIKP